MDAIILISTHNRQQSCQRLVDSLQGQGDIVVLNDGCDYDISGATQKKRKMHFGKQGYWCTVNQLFDMRGKHKYYFMLPDDFLPVDNMVERAIALWEEINEPHCVSINLYTDRVGLPCWTKFKPLDHGNVWLTQWVDMCFIAGEKFFIKLGKIPQINFDWKHHPTASSGVGKYISQRLYNHGCNMYMAKSH